MEELIKGGIIARCVGPVDFLARSHFVMKADGLRVRLVTDYSRALNPCLRKAEHGFTCAKEIREGLSSTAKYYTVLDLPHAYFQKPLTEKVRELTAFVADVGTGAHRYV